MHTDDVYLITKQQQKNSWFLLALNIPGILLAQIDSFRGLVVAEPNI